MNASPRASPTSRPVAGSSASRAWPFALSTVTRPLASTGAPLEVGATVEHGPPAEPSGGGGEAADDRGPEVASLVKLAPTYSRPPKTVAALVLWPGGSRIRHSRRPVDESSSTIVPPAGHGHFILRPSTAGSGSWTATVLRSCGHGDAAHRGWPTRPAHLSSSGWLPSPRPSRLRTGPHRRRARPTQLERDPAVDQWGVAGAGPPRPEHSSQAVRPGHQLRGPTRA
jgi:hypothetical protein